MSSLTWLGIFRYRYQGPIINSTIDAETGLTSEGLALKLPFYGSPDYCDTLVGRSQRTKFFKYMEDYADLIAVYLANSTYYCLVFSDHIEMRDHENLIVDSCACNVQVEHLKGPEDCIPVGFIKTYVGNVTEVLISPQRIYYNPKTKMYLTDKGWRKTKLILKEHKKMDIYRKLVNEEKAHGIVVSETGIHFIRKEV